MCAWTGSPGGVAFSQWLEAGLEGLRAQSSQYRLKTVRNLRSEAFAATAGFDARWALPGISVSPVFYEGNLDPYF